MADSFVETSIAKNAGLIQQSIWLNDTEKERKLLKKMYDQIMKNPKRRCMYVKRGGEIALFTNDIRNNRKYNTR